MKKFLWFILTLSLVANLLALAVFDRTLFYRNKIAADEAANYNQGLRTDRFDLIRQAGYEKLGVVHGGNLVRYWYLPAEVSTPLVNQGGIEETVEGTHSKLEQVVNELSPRFVVINAGFCQIHTAVHEERDIEAAVASNLEALRSMVAVTGAADVVAVLSSLAPVRATHLFPYTGWVERPTVKKETENRAIQDYNARVKTLAAEFDLPFFDFHAVLADTDGQLNKAYALTDGEHLNQAGYRALDAYLSRQLASLLATGVF